MFETSQPFQGTVISSHSEQKRFKVFHSLGHREQLFPGSTVVAFRLRQHLCCICIDRLLTVLHLRQHGIIVQDKWLVKSWVDQYWCTCQLLLEGVECCLTLHCLLVHVVLTLQIVQGCSYICIVGNELMVVSSTAQKGAKT